MEPRLGDLIVCRNGPNPIERAIERVEDSDIFHIAGYVGDGQIIQAEGFRATGYGALSFYRGQDIYTWPAWVTDEQRAGIVKWAKAHVGGKYAYGVLFWELIRYACHVKLPWWAEYNHYICSWYWAAAARANKVDLWPGLAYPAPPDMAAEMVYNGLVQ